MSTPNPNPNAGPKLLQFDAFAPVHGPITIPANTYFCRGRNSKYASFTAKRSLYLTGDARVAQGYADLEGPQGCVTWYRTLQPLQVFDLRYVRLLIMEALSTPRDGVIPVQDIAKFVGSARAIKTAYGACSLVEQIRMVKKLYINVETAPHPQLLRGVKALEAYYNSQTAWNAGADLRSCDPLEPLGTRLGETHLDMEAVSILSVMFSDRVAGYIAPELLSPFQVARQGVMHSELVIFDPSSQVIEEAPDLDLPTLTLMPCRIDNLLGDRLLWSIPLTTQGVRVGIYAARGGGRSTKPRLRRSPRAMYNPGAAQDAATDEQVQARTDRAKAFCDEISHWQFQQRGVQTGGRCVFPLYNTSGGDLTRRRL
jgi:hypothetical protein